MKCESATTCEVCYNLEEIVDTDGVISCPCPFGKVISNGECIFDE